MFLRQSTASQEIMLGPFLDDTTGKDAETGLTINNTDIKIWKHGGTTESNKNSGGATHIASGRYYAVLDATDTDTIGLLEVNVHVSGALPVRRQFVVLDEAVYDVLLGTTALSTYAGADTSGTTTLLSRIGGSITITSGRVNADVTHIAAAAVSTSTAQIGVNVVNAGGTAWASGALTSGVFATGAITAGAIAADAITDAKVASDVTIASVTGAVGSVTGNVGGNVAGSVASVTAGVTVSTISANVITASALAADAANEIADVILSRNVSNVEGSAAEHTLCTLVLACLEFAVSDTTWTIKRTDGTTTHYTKTLTTNAAADPVTGVT